MFRVAMTALLLTATPAMAMTHAECVGHLAEAYDAKDRMWVTSEALHEADSEAIKNAKDEAVGARLAAQKYINALADFCESLR